MAVQRQVGAQTDAKPSTEDLRGKTYRFAKRVAGGFALCGAGQQAAGTIQEGKNVGQHTSIATGNQLKVVAGAAVAAGVKIASDAQGRAVLAAGAGTEVLGKSINATAAVGELLEIDFRPEGPIAA